MSAVLQRNCVEWKRPTSTQEWKKVEKKGIGGKVVELRWIGRFRGQWAARSEEKRETWRHDASISVSINFSSDGLIISANSEGLVDSLSFFSFSISSDSLAMFDWISHSTRLRSTRDQYLNWISLSKIHKWPYLLFFPASSASSWTILIKYCKNDARHATRRNCSKIKWNKEKENIVLFIFAYCLIYSSSIDLFTS